MFAGPGQRAFNDALYWWKYLKELKMSGVLDCPKRQLMHETLLRLTTKCFSFAINTITARSLGDRNTG